MYQIKTLLVILGVFFAFPALIGWLCMATGMTATFWFPAGIVFAVVSALVGGWLWWFCHNFRM